MSIEIGIAVVIAMVYIAFAIVVACLCITATKDPESLMNALLSRTSYTRKHKTALSRVIGTTMGATWPVWILPLIALAFVSVMYEEFTSSE